jgi:hypothetical protein
VQEINSAITATHKSTTIEVSKVVQLFHASSPHVLFRLLPNIVAKLATQQRPIAATPAVQARKQ